MSGVLVWDFDGTLATRPGHWDGRALRGGDARLPGARRDAPISCGRICSAGSRGTRPTSCAIPAPTTSGGAAPSALRRRAARRRRARQRGRLAPRRHPAGALSRSRRVAAVRRHGARARAAAASAAGATWFLSNHVPELGSLVETLGLSRLLSAVYCSALIGVEKPHPKAFEAVFADHPEARAGWMIGDSWRADVQGASGGRHARDSRSRSAPGRRRALRESLHDVIAVVEETPLMLDELDRGRASGRTRDRAGTDQAPRRHVAVPLRPGRRARRAPALRLARPAYSRPPNSFHDQRRLDSMSMLAAT